MPFSNSTKRDNYNYYRSIFSDISKPLACVDLDLLNKNIDFFCEKALDKNIRIATKSIRSVQLIRYILDSDPKFKGLMCYDINEAIWLSKTGFDDILIAYPVVDSNKIESLCVELNKSKTIYLMVDSSDHLRLINKVALKHNTVIPVCLDLDMSSVYPGLYFGVYRSSIQNLAQLDVFINVLAECSHVKLAGMMGYEAQIAGLGDAYPNRKIMNQVIRFLKKESNNTIQKRRNEVLKTIYDTGIQLDFVNGGGTGSILMSSRETSLTEVTVGSGFFCPTLFDNYNDFELESAAFYAIEIVRQPQKNIFTCLGGGYVASGAMGNDKLPKIHLPVGAELFKNEMAGEVQTPIKYSGKNKLDIGDPVFLRHAKAGELMERFEKIYLVQNGQIKDVVETYRGSGQCFL